jgi:aminopeptidase N
MPTLLSRSLFLVLILIAAPAVAQDFIPHTETHLRDPQEFPKEHPVDMQNMRIEVSFEPTKGLVKGRVTHSFIPLRQRVDSIEFNAVGITIKTATLDGKTLRYKNDGTKVTVFPEPALTWGKKDEITFEYEATPKRGIYFIGWNDPRGLSRKQIWTQGQGIDNRHWIPMYDETNDKMTTETITTIDKQYKVLSNGAKISEKENKDGTKTWHYKMSHPHASYLVMLGIGDYAIKTDKTKGGVPLNLYYYPEWKDRVEPTYKYSAEAVDFVADWVHVPYAWESYSQIPVQDFIYGAMENTTATVFGDFYHVDDRIFLDRNYIGVNVHELAHQWFGDLVTGRSGENQWLQESFATFFPKMFSRKYFGEDAYQWNRRGEHNGSLAASLADLYPVNHTKGGTSRVYGKGSTVIEMMHYAFGEDQVRRVLEHFLRHHAYQNVETNDLYQSFQDTLGITPYWFFDEWLYRGGEPHYEVNYQEGTINGQNSTQIMVQQIHETNDLVGLFKMPIDFIVYYTDGSRDSVRKMIEKQTTVVDIPNPGRKQISFVLFDPGSHVLKKVTFNKDFEELRAQALGATNMIDRYDAIVALKSDSTSMAAKRQLMMQVFDREKYYAVKAEIVSQLANDNSPEAIAFLRRALHDPMTEVRSAVITNINRIPQDLLADFETMLDDSSYNNIFNALEKLADQYPQNNDRYIQMVDNEYGPGNRVRIKRYELMAMKGDRIAIDSLAAYLGSSYEFWTRQNALNAVKKLNLVTEATAMNMMDALVSPNNRLAGNAAGVIDYLMQQDQNRRVFMTAMNSRTWRPNELQTLSRHVK